MQLAIIHHHLNRGGVTQVIANHLQALGCRHVPDWPERVAILYGGRRRDWPGEVARGAPFPVELVEVPSLDYDERPIAEAARLHRELQAALADRGFVADQTIVHCHNHSLGKNASLPGALGQLAEGGYRLLLQVHDFAEDCRPANYRHLAVALAISDPAALAEQLYPQGAGIHYAVLTRRDHALLAAAGVDPGRLHLLPNPVAGFDGLPAGSAVRTKVRQVLGLPSDARLVVYPVRGIRRKNVGEMLLLAALRRRDTTFAVTLAPLNPVERESFDRWCALSGELGLPCRFDTGGAGGPAYLDVLAATDAIVSTSVAEGFGMVFLEAWLAGRPLVGRNLPEVTADFVADGIRFPWSYDELDIPTAWLDLAALRHEWADVYHAACRAYGVPPAADSELSRGLDRRLSGTTVDFAALPPTLQTSVIRRVWSQADDAAELLAANARLSAIGDVGATSAGSVIDANARLIRKEYSLEAAGERLAGVYRTIGADPRSDRLERLSAGETILDQLLDVARLHPVRLQ